MMMTLPLPPRWNAVAGVRDSNNSSRGRRAAVTTKTADENEEADMVLVVLLVLLSLDGGGGGGLLSMGRILCLVCVLAVSVGCVCGELVSI